MLLIDFAKRYYRVKELSSMLSIKELFLDSKKIEKVIKWWSINTGVTSPSSISGCYYHLRMLAKQFLRTETNPQHRISLNLCNEDLKGEENRWYRLSSRVTRENSRESVRREQGRWLELEDIQKLTRHSHERGKALVKRATVETSSTVGNKNNKKRMTRSSGSVPVDNQKTSSLSSSSKDLLTLSECKEYQLVLWIMLMNSTACQRPGVFFNMNDSNCKKTEDGHYVWKPFMEKNTIVTETELRTIDWPSDLTEWIDFHLRVVRPRICALNDLDSVPARWWLNTQGTPLDQTMGTQWFKSFMWETIGIELNFRDYRWCQCALENSYPSSPEEHERFLYLSDHTQSTVDMAYKMIRDVPREKGNYETLSFHQSIRGLDSVSIGYQSSPLLSTPNKKTTLKKKNKKNKNKKVSMKKKAKTTTTTTTTTTSVKERKDLVGDENYEFSFEMNSILFSKD